MAVRGVAELGQKAVGRIERARWLDPVGYRLGNAVALPLRLLGGKGQRVRNALHGTWFGHPLHPTLVAVPIGSWTAALVFDALDSFRDRRTRRYAEAADLAVAVGCVGAVVAALAGLNDWQHIHGRSRRVGLAHGAINTFALALFGSSLALRRRGRRRGGRLLGALGWGVVFGGAYLGGDLVYRRRIGVDQADRRSEPRDFVPVLPEHELEEDTPRYVEAEGVRVVLVRHRGRIHALGERCSHMGGPLSGGWILRGGLVCPWHGSRYDLETGCPLDGPSTSPQPRFEVRVRDGAIEVRRAPEAGASAEHPSWSERLRGRGAPAAGGPLKADEVLFRHHETLRELFRRVEATPRDDPRRRELMDVLAGELEIHEQIEDEIFYPAVRPVTESVPMARSEHRQLADLLAVVVGLNPSTDAFEEHLGALHRAVEHHAGSEERTMFPEAQRLGDAVLRELGGQLSARLEELRGSRFQRLRRALKLELLKRI